MSAAMKNNMVHIIIDSSVLREWDWQRSGAMKAIERLSQEGSIQIHISYVVEREYSSAQKAIMKKGRKAISKEINQLLKGSLPIDSRNQIETVQKQLESSINFAIDEVGTHLEKWATRAKALIVPIENHHGERVIRDYFAGDPPYKQPKNRVDIPDSFIWQIVEDLLTAKEDVAILSADNGMRDAADKRKLPHYATISQFVASARCQELLKSSYAIQNLKNCLIGKNSSSTNLDDKFKEMIEVELVGQTVQHPNILDDNNEGTIDAIQDILTHKFDMNQVSYYGDGVFAIAFTATVNADVQSFLYKSEYFTLEKNRAEKLFTEDWNDHYFLIEESKEILIEGLVEIDLKTDKVEQEDTPIKQLENPLDDDMMNPLVILVLEVLS